MSSRKTPLEMLYYWEKTVPDQVFLRQSLGDGDWIEYTWSQVADRVRRLSSFIQQQLKARQLPCGTCIGIWSANSADWVIVDLAIMLSGNVSVPLYPGQDKDTSRYILEHAEVKLLFVGEFDLVDSVHELLESDVMTVSMKGFPSASKSQCDSDLDAIWAGFDRDESCRVPAHNELLTVIYSSGTTGKPKGVMLQQLVAGEAATVFDRWMVSADKTYDGERSRLFSYLPLSHALERFLIFFSGLYHNACIAFSAGQESFPAELRAVEPTLFISVPRLWQKFKESVESRLPNNSCKGMTESEKQAVRQMLGLGKANSLISGSAPLPKEVSDWYYDMGMVVREGYSMTEAIGCGAFWLSEDRPQPGCVGQVVGGVEVKLTDAGEICLKGKGMMHGYYRDPERTAVVLKDGWYHTGDRGRLDDEDKLWLSGRVGDVFKTSKGKFVDPIRLEAKLAIMSQLEQMIVIGHGRAQPIVIANLTESSKQIDRQEITIALKDELQRVNETLPAYERIETIYITRSEWLMKDGLLTPTLKIKRKAVEEYYQTWMEQVNNSEAVHWLEA